MGRWLAQALPWHQQKSGYTTGKITNQDMVVCRAAQETFLGV